MARLKKIKEIVSEVLPEVIVVSDELTVLDSDSAEQKRLKGVFLGFRNSNPYLWNRDKEIYLKQIANAK